MYVRVCMCTYLIKTPFAPLLYFAVINNITTIKTITISIIHTFVVVVIIIITIITTIAAITITATTITATATITRFAYKHIITF